MNHQLEVVSPCASLRVVLPLGAKHICILSLPGAHLKVCPQGFSCCTVEMEEKLSQQSHTEIKAPVSRLSTSLQSTFRQRHDHFDSKQTRVHRHTSHFSDLIVPLSSIVALVLQFLMDAPTCQRTAQSGDTQSVSVGLSTCPSAI